MVYRDCENDRVETLYEEQLRMLIVAKNKLETTARVTREVNFTQLAEPHIRKRDRIVESMQRVVIFYT